MKRFLIIQTAFIGDVILATPIIEKLHGYFPEAKIDFLLRKGNEGLFEKHPYINQLLIWDKKNKKYINYYRIIKQVRRNKYDCVINVHRFTSSGIITVMSGSKLKIGFDKNPFSFLFNQSVKHIIQSTVHSPQSTVESQYIHEIDRNLALIKGLTDEKRYLPKLYLSAEDYASTKQYKNKDYICIAPASVWFTKQYPEERWIEFIHKTQVSNIKTQDIYLIGGKNDFDFCNNIINKSKNQKIRNFAGKLTFLQTAAMMKEARMNYVNDSAPMHIASAVNAPVTVIFCSTVPGFGFGPLSDRAIIVQKEEELYCRPCGLHGFSRCPEKHFKCALDIKTEQLLKVLSAKY